MLEKFKRIMFCFIAGVIVVMVLYQTSGTLNTYKNGFKRNINSQFLKPCHSLDIGQTSFVLTGATRNLVYISNLKDPLKIHDVDTSLKRNELKSWKFPMQAEPSELNVITDSPAIYIYDRGKNTISTFYIKGESVELNNEDSISDRQFDLCVQVSSNSFVLRTINKDLNQYTLSKFQKGATTVKENTSVITKQLDGFLCSDGILFYDKTMSRIVYLYFYRNQFIILDSNLNVIIKANTIDTVSIAQIKIHHFIREKYVTFEAPAFVVNKKACVWKGRLYIESGLLSDNEDRKMFSNNSIVDTYDLHTGGYLFSFYIPHFNQYKVDGFQVSDSLLISIQGNFIVSHVINNR